ncbi:MAG: hypothetical protein JXM70_30630 [Pirellulales bacterium]|nr:hypothetical protein [Pirellulales bacterium]
MEAKTRREIDTLFSALVDGNLRDEQQERLGKLLEQYPEAQDIYLAYFDIHTELSLTGGVGDVSQDCPPEPVFQPSTTTYFLNIRPIRRLWAGVAAAIILVMTVWLLFSLWPDPSTPVIARLVSTENARWVLGPTYSVAGEGLAPGEVRLEEGIACIQMLSGAELVLQAPVMIELVDSTVVCLEQGNLTVSVSDECVGFRVLTPMAHLVDMGTEFGVDVDKSGTTEVHVFQGVVVAKSTASGSVVPINAQEAGRIDAPRDRRDLMYGEFVSVKLDRSRFSGLSASSVDTAFDLDNHSANRTIQRLQAGARIVFLGDHATSRETHILLINQALSFLPPDMAPRLFNAAWAFPLFFNEEHYQQHVESFAPTHAVIEFGPEIAGYSQPRSPEDFRHAITRLVDRLEQSGIEPIIATGFAIPQNNPRAKELLESYNGSLRKLAVQRGYRLADVNVKSRKHPDCEPELVNTYFAPTFEGFRVMAGALLESFGYPEASVPRSLDISLLPGVITNWKMRLRPHNDSLNTESVAKLVIDETWAQLSLPQDDKLSRRLAQPGRSFVHHDRARGFATHLTESDNQIVQAVSCIESEIDRGVFFNTGARLLSIWLNGEKIFESNNPWAGWHPGKERIPARLRAGRNQIIIESQDAFFLSITNERDWALPRTSTSNILEERLDSQAVDLHVSG